MKTKKGKISPMVGPLYIWTVVFTLLPLVYVAVMSVMSRGSVFGIQPPLTLGSYAQLANTVYIEIFGESLKIASLTTLLTLLIGYPFAYFTALMPPKRRSVVLLLLIAPFWTNSLIRLYALVSMFGAQGVINASLMTAGIIDEPLKIMYTFGATLIGMIYALSPFMILGIYNSVEKLDWSVIEAARDLGAGQVRAFVTMTLPLTMPGIMAGCVLTFVPSIGLFFISDILGGGKTMLVGNMIRNEMLTARNWPLGATLAVIMMALSMLFLFVYRKMAGDKSLEGLL